MKARWGQPGDGAACGWLKERAEETAGSCWCCSGEGQRVAMELRRELLLEDDGKVAASGSEEDRRESRLPVRRWDETKEVGGGWRGSTGAGGVDERRRGEGAPGEHLLGRGSRKPLLWCWTRTGAGRGGGCEQWRPGAESEGGIWIEEIPRRERMDKGGG